ASAQKDNHDNYQLLNENLLKLKVVLAFLLLLLHPKKDKRAIGRCTVPMGAVQYRTWLWAAAQLALPPRTALLGLVGLWARPGQGPPMQDPNAYVPEELFFPSLHQSQVTGESFHTCATRNNCICGYKFESIYLNL
uniref:Uncharacterized protein n=1 Tax=Romanomermis culicivorax TaxID=13658 RepID=A0A915KBN5_ROMCU